MLPGNARYVAQPAQLPDAATLPPAERRRVGRVVKLALAVGYQAACRGGAGSCAPGDGLRGFRRGRRYLPRNLPDARVSDRSPDFPDPVPQLRAQRSRRILEHCGQGARAPSTSLCAFDGSFGAGLLEASMPGAGGSRSRAADHLRYRVPGAACTRVRPIPDAFGMALLLSPERGACTLGRVDVELTADAADVAGRRELESLRTGYPAARGLPLLTALARGQPHRHVLDYLDDRRLAVTIDRRDWRDARHAGIASRIPHKHADVPAGRRGGMGRSPRRLPRGESPRSATIRSARTAGSVPPAASNTRRRPWPCMARCWPPKGHRPRIGYLTSVREVTLRASAARRCRRRISKSRRCGTAGDGNNVVYRFTVRADQRELLCGRAAVVLDSDRTARFRAGGNA